jgi:N-acetylneuraminic acid mutarotase
MFCLGAGWSAASAQANQWAWTGGSNQGYEPPVPGTLGTPAAGNIPAARYETVTWTDKNGNFWLFGGDYSSSPNGDLILNDLWEFNPATKEWGWMAGSTTANTPGVYGTKGAPAVGNVPGSREDASGWTDSQGNLWLFGGYGLDSGGNWGVLNDLWEFSPASGQWTWMSGSSTVGNCIRTGWCAQPSVYGTLGTAGPGNTPGSRDGAITWTDKKGDLWLYGGWGYDVPAQTQYYYNELWEFDPSTNEWAWMGGSSTRDGSACFEDFNFAVPFLRCGEPGAYGTEGSPAAGNFPGGRAGSAGWTDSEGSFWLFSGNGFDINGYFGDPNDLWKFDTSSKQWTWVSGTSAITSYGCDFYFCSGPSSYNSLGNPGGGDVPMGRDHAAAWTDGNGNLWFYGGGGNNEPNAIGILEYLLNDLWMFNPTTNQWTLMGGNYPTLCGDYCAQTPGAVYGAPGTPTAGSFPGSRFSPAGWTDPSGNLWLFGGAAVNTGYLFNNDLWEYQPSATAGLPTTATPIFSVKAGSYSSARSVAISDATTGTFMYYTTDGTTPTFTSSYYNSSFSPPISVQRTETLKVIAVADGCYPSAVASATYSLPAPAATPAFSVPAGTYKAFQTVTITDTTKGAAIYYTLDGTTPTTKSSVYTGPISITQSLTLKAVAIANNSSLSDVASASYALDLPTAAMPAFSVADGTYTTAQSVTLSDATPGAVIYYAINGYPSTTSSVYSGPITVSTSETIRAMATAKDYYPSDIAGAVYDINPNAQQTATPTFSVPAGTYSGTQTVSISDATNLASIYVTLDGSTPTPMSPLYTGPIVVSSSETLKAMATATGYTNSSVASAAYVISAPDFTLKASSGSLTVNAGGSGSIGLTVTPENGFNAATSFACSSQTSGLSCAFNPASVTPDGVDAATTTLTITASASASNAGPSRYPLLPAATLALGGGLLMWRRRRAFVGGIAGFVVLGGLAMLSACGGGGGSGGTTPPTPPPPTTANVTVTATSGALQQTATIALTINH